MPWSALPVLVAFVASPFLLSIINRTKAFFGGRKGRPLLQPYHDIAKLLKKGAVYSRTATPVFRFGPIVGLAAVCCALALTPMGGPGSMVSFEGDVILFAYLFALMRFAAVLAALDTGSSFEGMGASREVQFSALTEVAFLLGISAMAGLTHKISLSGMLGIPVASDGPSGVTVRTLVAAAFFIVLLAENSRIPVDDPETHLELTMIHEVMVLDHGGVDLGLIEFAGCLKLWIMSAVFLGTVLPVRFGNPLGDTALIAAGIGGIAVLIGIVESTMARLRLLVVPQLLVGAGIMSLLGLIVVLG
ncbi:MAG: NADH-quinone oxidoreductase subunit H [Proteobacteria bacterium]|nr:NADH-quinone oxidoreductase subunit H [Pseudomonadota bacterium]